VVLGFALDVVLLVVVVEAVEMTLLVLVVPLAILSLNGGFAFGFGVGGVATAGFRMTFMTFLETSTTKSPPSAMSAIMLGQSRRSKLNAANELTTRRRLS
jgi:uncharacterized membrane protein YdjX (TVP38/TMEM64 family)